MDILGVVKFLAAFWFTAVVRSAVSFALYLTDLYGRAFWLVEQPFPRGLRPVPWPSANSKPPHVITHEIS